MRLGRELDLRPEPVARVPKDELAAEAPARDEAARGARDGAARARRTAGGGELGAERDAAGADVDLRHARTEAAGVRAPGAAQRVRVHRAARVRVVGVELALVRAPSLDASGGVIARARGAHGEDAAVPVRHGRGAQHRVPARVRLHRGVALERRRVERGEPPVLRARVRELLERVERHSGHGGVVRPGLLGVLGERSRRREGVKVRLHRGRREPIDPRERLPRRRAPRARQWRGGGGDSRIF